MINNDYKKIFLVVLIAVLLLGAVLVLRLQRSKNLQKQISAVLSPTVTETVRPTSIPTTVPPRGFIIASTAKQNVPLNENIDVAVSFATNNNYVSGSDVILKFDPAFLEALPDIKTGDFFANYPRKLVDNVNGTVKVTAFGGKKEIVTSSTPIFNMVFKPKKAGNTEIAVEFQKGTTNLSTLVEQGTSDNILDRVTNINLITGP